MHFGQKGSKVVISGRRKEPLDETLGRLKEAGVVSLGILADVSKPEDCQRLVTEVLDSYGQIDVLINNAGISMRATFEEVDLDVIQKVMDINFFGAVNMTKVALPEILKSQGSVVGVSSIAGFRGLPGRVGYSASKFALQGFLEVLRTEMLYKGVHVLIASPGFTSSNIRKTALGADGSAQGESPRKEAKMMSAEECASHIYEAVRKRKKYLILTPQGKMTVFLNKLFPGFMDKIVFKAMAKEPGAPFSVPR